MTAKPRIIPLRFNESTTVNGRLATLAKSPHLARDEVALYCAKFCSTIAVTSWVVLIIRPPSPSAAASVFFKAEASAEINCYRKPQKKGVSFPTPNSTLLLREVQVSSNTMSCFVTHFQSQFSDQLSALGVTSFS